jgi:hypothetical protein
MLKKYIYFKCLNISRLPNLNFTARGPQCEKHCYRLHVYVKLTHTTARACVCVRACVRVCVVFFLFIRSESSVVLSAEIKLLDKNELIYYKNYKFSTSVTIY